MASRSYGNAYQGGGYGPTVLGGTATQFPEQLNSLQHGMKRLSLDTKKKSVGILGTKPARKVSITVSPSRHRTLSSERQSQPLALEFWHFQKGEDWSTAEGRFVDQEYDVMLAQVKRYRKEHSVDKELQTMSYPRRDSLERLVHRRNLNQKDNNVRWSVVSIKAPLEEQRVRKPDGRFHRERKSMDVIIALNPVNARMAGERIDSKQPFKSGDGKNSGKGDWKDGKDGKGSKGLKASSDADRRGDYLNNNDLFTQSGAPLDHGRAVQDLPPPDLIPQQHALPFSQEGGFPGFHPNQGMPHGLQGGGGGVEVFDGDHPSPPPPNMHGLGNQPFHPQGQKIHPDFLPQAPKPKMHVDPFIHQKPQQILHDDWTESSNSEFDDNYFSGDDEWATNTSVDSNPLPVSAPKHRGSLKQGRRGSLHAGEPLYRQHTRGYSNDEEPRHTEKYRPSGHYKGHHGGAVTHVAKTHRRRDSSDHHQYQRQRRIEGRSHHSPPRSPLSASSFELEPPRPRRGRGLGHAEDMNYPGQMPLSRPERDAERYMQQREGRSRPGGKELPYSYGGGGGGGGGAGGFPAYAQGGGFGGGHGDRHHRR